MRERYEPFLETENVNIHQKGDKTLIITKKEITFQSNDKLLKRNMKPEQERATMAAMGREIRKEERPAYTKTQMEIACNNAFKEGFKQGKEENNDKV